MPGGIVVGGGDGTGGGGGLPAWITVDSTPGQRTIDFGGTVTVSPDDASADPLTVKNSEDAPLVVISPDGGVAITLPDDFAPERDIIRVTVPQDYIDNADQAWVIYAENPAAPGPDTADVLVGLTAYGNLYINQVNPSIVLQDTEKDVTMQLGPRSGLGLQLLDSGNLQLSMSDSRTGEDGRIVFHAGQGLTGLDDDPVFGIGMKTLPPDVHVAPATIFFAVDDDDATPALLLKMATADGTIATATIPLTPA